MANRRSAILSTAVMLVIFSLVLIVLAALLGREREKARCAKCLNNIKQIAQALKMYSDDYNGVMPSSYFVRHSKRWNTADALTFCTTLGTYPPLGGVPYRTWPQTLYNDMLSQDVAFCPTDRVMQPFKPGDHPSYYYKLANDKAWYVGCKRMADYGYESDQIAFYERLGFHCGDKSGLKNGVKINVSYIDTHVETITIKNATSGDPTNCAASSDGEPMYYNTKVNGKTQVGKPQKGPAKLTDPTCSYDTL